MLNGLQGYIILKSRNYSYKSTTGEELFFAVILSVHINSFFHIFSKIFLKHNLFISSLLALTSDSHPPKKLILFALMKALYK